MDAVAFDVSRWNASLEPGREAPTGSDFEKSMNALRGSGWRTGICVGDSSAILELEDD